MSDYGYRIKKGQIRLVSDDDLADYPKPTDVQLAAYRQAVQDRTPKLEGFTTKLVPDERLDALIIAANQGVFQYRDDETKKRKTP